MRTIVYNIEHFQRTQKTVPTIRPIQRIVVGKQSMLFLCVTHIAIITECMYKKKPGI